MSRILVIDRDVHQGTFIRKTLERDGFLTSISLDGKEGLDQAMTGDFELVMVSMSLPNISGLEIIKILRDERPDIRVIAITGDDRNALKYSDNDVVGAFGVDYLLGKPFNSSQISKAVDAELSSAVILRDVNPFASFLN